MTIMVQTDMSIMASLTSLPSLPVLLVNGIGVGKALSTQNADR